MKCILVFSLATLFIAFSACKKSSISPNTPACIRETIVANKDNPNWEIGEVEEYEFQGKIVYAFNPDNGIIADAATRVVSSDCSQICYVGGFGGPDVTLCNGQVFYQKAILKRTIWKK